MRGGNIVIALTLVVVSVLGCMRYQAVAPKGDHEPYQRLSVGDRVSVITADARMIDFKVSGISDSALSGDDVEVPFSDVRIVRVRKIDASATAIGAATILFTIGVMGLMVVGPPPTMPGP
jgi:hypothetical protein